MKKKTSYDDTVSFTIEEADEFEQAMTTMKVFDMEGFMVGTLSSEEFAANRRTAITEHGYPIVVCEFSKVKCYPSVLDLNL